MKTFCKIFGCKGIIKEIIKIKGLSDGNYPLFEEPYLVYGCERCGENWFRIEGKRIRSDEK